MFYTASSLIQGNCNTAKTLRHEWRMENEKEYREMVEHDENILNILLLDEREWKAMKVDFFPDDPSYYDYGTVLLNTS